MSREKLYKLMPLDYLKSIGRLRELNYKEIEQIKKIFEKVETWKELKIIRTYHVKIRNKKTRLKVVDLEPEKIKITQHPYTKMDNIVFGIPIKWIARIK